MYNWIIQGHKHVLIYQWRHFRWQGDKTSITYRSRLQKLILELADWNLFATIDNIIDVYYRGRPYSWKDWTHIVFAKFGPGCTRYTFMASFESYYLYREGIDSIWVLEWYFPTRLEPNRPYPPHIEQVPPWAIHIPH